MLLVRGTGGGTTLTGTIFGPDEDAPRFRGAPDGDAAYVWVCDEFYEVESGGSVAEIDGRLVNIAFESPMPRGFETRDRAVEAAREHIRTQFARVGVPAGSVQIEIEEVDDRPADEAAVEEETTAEAEREEGDGDSEPAQS